MIVLVQNILCLKKFILCYKIYQDNENIYKTISNKRIANNNL